MEWGSNFDSVQRKQLLSLYEQGLPVPVLDDAPELPSSIQWVLPFFRDLRSCRQASMGGMLPIPVPVMRSYYVDCGYPPHLWPEVKTYLVAMDAEELKFYDEKRPARMPKEPEEAGQ